MSKTLQDILIEHGGEPGEPMQELIQDFLQWVADTCIGDDSDTPNVMIAMEHNRQRQILKDNGWMPWEEKE